MNFGDAIAALKAGSKVARSGWNGKGMWLELVNPESYDIYSAVASNGALELRPFIVMKTVDSHLVPWVASQTDMLAEDWELVK